MTLAFQTALGLLRAVFWVWTRVTPSVQVNGLRVYSTSAAKLDSELFGRLRDALALVREKDPSLYNRIRQYIRIVVFAPTGGTAEYWYHMKTCVLDSTYVLHRTTDWIALALVHESTHARLERFGISSQRFGAARMERICSNAEIQFASLLQDPEHLIGAIDDSFKRVWWTNTQRDIRNARRFEALGWPSWVFELNRYLSNVTKSESGESKSALDRTE